MSEIPFNDMTPAEVERLVLLSEECAEVQKIAAKSLRHGYESYNPDETMGPSNRSMLEIKVGDLLASLHLLALRNDIDIKWSRSLAALKLGYVNKYLHHNELKAEEIEEFLRKAKIPHDVINDIQKYTVATARMNSNDQSTA